MDFKGHFPAGAGRCHPLTVLDDHFRFSILLQACADERTETVRESLTATFRLYGLPVRMLMDNGSPSGHDANHPYTPLTAGRMHLGIQVSHGRPYHPQTQGKDERFHRTLNVELLQGRRFADGAACQAAFDWWRGVYNTERPHQALDLATPISRYTPSPRSFPETLPAIEYGDGDTSGRWEWKAESASKARCSQWAERCGDIRPTATDGIWGVWFMTHPIGAADLRGPEPQMNKSPDV